MSLTKEVRELALALGQSGQMTSSEIASKVGHSPSLIRDLLNRAGVRRPHRCKVCKALYFRTEEHKRWSICEPCKDAQVAPRGSSRRCPSCQRFKTERQFDSGCADCIGCVSHKAQKALALLVAASRRSARSEGTHG